MQSPIDRRQFLKLSAYSAFAFLSPAIGFADNKLRGSKEKSLNIHNPNTRETLSEVYWSDGRYQSVTLEKINHIMRDYHTGEITPIDVRLLDLLYELNSESEKSSPIRLISGYRSKKTNERLRRQGRSAAKNSFHLRGMAVDFQLPGTNLHSLFKRAADKQAGGVGYYPRQCFLHIDVGPIRYWKSPA